MSAYTKTTPGAPTTGFYSVNDSVIDSNNVTWMCVKTGFAGTPGMVGSSQAQFAASIAGVVPVTALGVGTVSGTGASVVERADGLLHQTTITLAALAQAVVNGTEYQSTKIYTFPEARILVLGVTATLTQTTTSVLASTLNASSTGAVALGTVAASNVSLTSTMVNLLPSTAFTSSATINVAGTAVSAALAAAAQFDGTATAIPVYLNSAFATTTDVDADATMTWAGTIVVTWLSLGDY